MLTLAAGLATVLATGPGTVSVQASQDPLSDINHIVVIYEENHSFDNLYGGWEGVNGRASATAAEMTQLTQAGTAYACLPQNDVNLPACISPNAPFGIETYIPASALTCPAPGTSFGFPHGVPANTPGALPGGCTEDIVHRFYQEQYQLNGGLQNHYTTGSDAIGLTQHFYDTTQLPIYLFLHQDGAPHYAIADNFFQGAFGGSFLNHQYLIAAAAPTWPGAPAANHSVIDSNGMPNKYPQYTPTEPVSDKQLTQACPSAVANRACGDFAVNTIQPAFQPFKGSPQLPPQTGNNIGDELTTAGVSWAWYSGGWSNADGIVGGPGWTNGTTPGVCGDPNSAPNPVWPFCPNKVFQYHHQPFNYFANYGPGTPGRAHLQDEESFFDLAAASGKQCQLNSVSFVKPVGLENEHPGYTSESEGSNHLVSLISAIENSACRKDTMVVVTYDEFGGQWDHVAPPGQGGTAGPHDLFGPGTRIPALIISPHLKGDFVVDHTQYDTTSILATIENRYSLPRLGATTRDGAVNDLSNVFGAHEPFDD
ncbi:MAG TPA: alkaline phosphatase family protein [Candidatus Dormibacteraeota bacterium]|nr:alkaline phosphatase family protein [Candidatus Dormibacteraeota bacterium]